VSSRTARRYRPRTKLLLSFFSFCLAVLACEAILRIIDYDYTPLRIDVVTEADYVRSYHAFKDEHFRHDPKLIWRPNEDYPVFNSQGFRGTELSEAKRAGEFRIFAIGDSNTLGWDEKDEGPDGRRSDWPAVLEELLASSDREVVVVNAGVWGYSSFQGLQRLKEILRYQPDMVLISFGGNDAHKVVVSDAEFASAIPRSPAFKTKIGQLLLGAWDGVNAHRRSRTDEDLVFRVSPEEYRNNLNEIIAISKHHGIQCVLLTRPFTGPPDEELSWKNFAPGYVAATIEIGRNKRVRVVDLYSEFQDRPECFLDEAHFNKQGHRVAARILCEQIRPLLPP